MLSKGSQPGTTNSKVSGVSFLETQHYAPPHPEGPLPAFTLED